MTIRRFNRLFGVLAMALATVLLISSPADAEIKKKKKQKSRQVLFLDLDLNFTYDENIIRYSDADLDLFDESASPDKFDIESESDWIMNPLIEARLKGRFIDGRTAWIGLRYNYYYYARNDIRRYQKAGMFARHYYTRGGYAELEYSYIPDYYYRNQFISGQGYVNASFSKHYLKFEIGQDLTKSLKGDISYRYQNKTYNPEVSERDLTVNGVRFDGIWKANNNIKLWAYYGFERANAAGADIFDIDIKDVSYDAWDITLGARYYTNTRAKIKPEFFSTVQFREIKFRTTKYLDEYRFERDDHNFRFRIGTVVHMFYKIRFDIYYTFQQKRVDLPIRSNETLLEYQASSVSFGFQRSF